MFRRTDIATLAITSLASLLVGCSFADDASYELLSADADGARFRIKCAPSRIEVGIRNSAPLPSATTRGSFDSPLSFPTNVRVSEGNDAKVISETSAARPAVSWLSGERVEYIGLQEIELPFAWWQCWDYVVDMRFLDVPERTAGHAPYVPYARTAPRR